MGPNSLVVVYVDPLGNRTLRVQVPNNHKLTQNLYYHYYYPKPKYLIIGYLDPLGHRISEPRDERPILADHSFNLRFLDYLAGPEEGGQRTVQDLPMGRPHGFCGIQPWGFESGALGFRDCIVRVQ